MRLDLKFEEKVLFKYNLCYDENTENFTVTYSEMFKRYMYDKIELGHDKDGLCLRKEDAIAVVEELNNELRREFANFYLEDWWKMRDKIDKIREIIEE